MISPWSRSATLPSPDGKITAEIDEAWEVGMGAPTSGKLILSNGMSRESCNPSFVWSDCSRFLAVPLWTVDRKQRLMVISIDHRQSSLVEGEFGVLELHAYNDGMVTGIDSPIHRPTEFRVDTSTITW